MGSDGISIDSIGFTIRFLWLTNKPLSTLSQGGYPETASHWRLVNYVVFFCAKIGGMLLTWNSNGRRWFLRNLHFSAGQSMNQFSPAKDFIQASGWHHDATRTFDPGELWRKGRTVHGKGMDPYVIHWEIRWTSLRPLWNHMAFIGKSSPNGLI